jgi:cytoskeletal protein CcmA (bactofilin family)
MKLVKGYLGSDVRMDGSLETNDSLRIDATFVGNVSSTHSVVVGTRGRVMGIIQAPVIKVDGWVDGDLKAGKLVEVLGNARIEGNIYTPVGGLKMRLGGEFKGKFIMHFAK